MFLTLVFRVNANTTKIPTDLKTEIGSKVSMEMPRPETHLMKNKGGLAPPDDCHHVVLAQG